MLRRRTTIGAAPPPPPLRGTDLMVAKNAISRSRNVFYPRPVAQDEQDDVLHEDGACFDGDCCAPGSSTKSSESAMKSYALPVIMAMLAVLIAFSWLG